MTTSFTIDRLTITGLAIAAMLPFLALSPAKAASVNCQAEVAAVQAQAEGATPDAAAKALRTARLAEKICAEGNRFEAAKKFAQARQQLDTGVQLAQNR
ncbi:hypothetical protein [Sandarakinorhabdus rubra]|uniref:hypothetical protein n=1 Tax=Sandarakinorhabdus rubra TaxID=2672568 RepID=UPI0013D9EA14|nr:hypothetical protein [Sandarakinorhabdus rubra]